MHWNVKVRVASYSGPVTSLLIYRFNLEKWDSDDQKGKSDLSDFCEDICERISVIIKWLLEDGFINFFSIPFSGFIHHVAT